MNMKREDNETRQVPIPEHVASLETYKAGKPIEELAREKGLNTIVKLASNENPLGPSPKAVAAIKAAAEHIHRYVDPSSVSLIEAICKKYKVRHTSVMCGSGTDTILSYIVMAFSEQGDDVVSAEGTFIGWYVNVRKHGRNLIRVPLKNWGFDLDGILSAITPATRMIFIANPNNPTGSMIPRDEFEQFMERVPQDVLVVLDEAYDTYASQFPEYPNGLRYEYPNMIVTRTLSKVYGLAGLRIGFAVGAERLIKALYKVRLPFEPNSLATAAAIAAFEDDDFVNRTIETNNDSLTRFRECFDRLGITYAPTWANFIMLVMPNEQFAMAFYNACLDLGLIVRPLGSFGIPQGIRINSGTTEETTFAISAIEKAYPVLLAQFNLPSSIKQTDREARII
jgi:histidinol-phosphate aminotransferase